MHKNDFVSNSETEQWESEDKQLLFNEWGETIEIFENKSYLTIFSEPKLETGRSFDFKSRPFS